MPTFHQGFVNSVFAEEGRVVLRGKALSCPYHMTPVLWRPTAAGTGSADLDLADGVPPLSPAFIRDEAVAL